MVITELTEAYVPAVASLEKSAFSEPWSEASIRGELENPWAIWLLAVEGGALAGYLGVQYGPDGGNVVTVATDPALRGRGAAKALFSAMEDRLREKGLAWLTLEVRPSNEAALGLYTALGFQTVGRRPRFYRKPTEDALLLTWFFRDR